MLKQLSNVSLSIPKSHTFKYYVRGYSSAVAQFNQQLGNELKVGTKYIKTFSEFITIYLTFKNTKILKSNFIYKIQDIEAAGTWKKERIITTRQGTSVGVEGKSGSLLNFCANNYLGLSVINLRNIM